MEIFISRLPYDILRDHILPYTYRQQDGVLLGDIVSFHSTWTIIERNYKKTFQALGSRAATYQTMMHNMKRYCHPGIGYGPGFNGRSFRCTKWCRVVWSRWAPYRRQYFVAEKVPILQRICSRLANLNTEQREHFASNIGVLLDH